MLDEIAEQLTRLDLKLTENITHFLNPYMTAGNMGGLTELLPVLIKFGIYTLIAILPIAFVKLLHPYSKFFTTLLFLLLMALSFSIIGIFFGLLQILFL